MNRRDRAADLTSMPSWPPPTPVVQEHESQPPPRERLEELLGRDFTAFLVDALTEPPPRQGWRGSSSP